MAYTHSEFVKNDCHVSRKVSENLALLQDWQKVYSGDSFDFDYHLVWDHYKDLGYFEVAKTLFSDMKALADFDLNGMVSCQMTRACFPHNLPMQLMADALWDKTADFELQSSRYFAAAFGKDGEAVKAYMRDISRLLNLAELRGDAQESAAAVLENYRNLKRLVTEFKVTVAKNLDCSHEFAVKKSWEYLTYHAEIVLKLVAALTARAEGKEEERATALASLLEYNQLNEMHVHKVYDVWQSIPMLTETCKSEHEYKKD